MTHEQKVVDSSNQENNKISSLLNSDSLENKRENKYFSSEKYIFLNPIADIFTYILILVVFFGSFHMYNSLDSLMHEIKKNNKDYNFSSYKELLPSVWILALMIIGHEIFRYLFSEKIVKHLNSRYFIEKDEDLVEIYKKKVASNIYKFVFYLISTIFGFYVLKDLNFFPWSLLGKGEFKNLFVEGYPNIFYFEKPEYFDLYYNFNLSFALFDGYLLITNPLQSDFLIMVLHHLSTYSLITFSFLSNLSNIGCIVYYLFYLGDVFSYIVRVAVHLNCSEFYPFISTFVFLVVFSYTRLFVYGDVLYQIYYGLNYTWTLIESNLVGFLCILMILNIMWIVLISRKFIKYCLTGNIEEIYKFKVNKKKEN
jgi:hypothetical protein